MASSVAANKRLARAARISLSAHALAFCTRARRIINIDRQSARVSINGGSMALIAALSA